jgi:ankyrin repeat protein
MSSKDLLKFIHEGNYEKVQQLLEEGIDPNTPVFLSYFNKEKDTYPLIQAVQQGNISIVNLLINHKANINVSTKWDGETPLHSAFFMSNENWDHKEKKNRRHKMIKYLVEHGADVNAQGGFCVTPLLQAVSDDDSIMVEYLIQNGADVNMRLDGRYVDENESRTTAIGMAVLDNNIEMLKLLIKLGGDPSLDPLSEVGFTHLDDAREFGNEEMIQILIQYGAK